VKVSRIAHSLSMSNGFVREVFAPPPLGRNQATYTRVSR
jgi:hypothetical protein